MALGASVLARYEAWITLAGPAGNEFRVSAGHD